MVSYQALHIPEPCTKIHYDDLPYDPDKRPCHLCRKPVYDFRDKDEAFLQKIWKENQGDFVGLLGIINSQNKQQNLFPFHFYNA